MTILENCVWKYNKTDGSITEWKHWLFKNKLTESGIVDYQIIFGQLTIKYKQK